MARCCLLSCCSKWMLNWMGLPLRRNSFIGLILLLILAHRVGFYIQSLQRRSASVDSDGWENVPARHKMGVKCQQNVDLAFHFFPPLNPFYLYTTNPKVYCTQRASANIHPSSTNTAYFIPNILSIRRKKSIEKS